jgi:hypothetical protein
MNSFDNDDYLWDVIHISYYSGVDMNPFSSPNPYVGDKTYTLKLSVIVSEYTKCKIGLSGN